jgi:hypothetical protein
MANMLGNQETVTVEELVVSNSYELAAIFNILERKGLINKTEFMEEVKRLHKEVKPPVDPDPYVMRG